MLCMSTLLLVKRHYYISGLLIASIRKEEFGMEATYFFLAVMVPVILLWLAFGPKLLLVKSIWVGAGVLFFVCGIMIAGAGGVAATVGGLFFVISGVIVVIAAVKSYLKTHLRWSRERHQTEGKPHSLLDNLE